MKLEKELFLYVLFGILTTMINIISYFVFTRIAGVNYLISNIISWILSVLFAYYTNRKWVFESKNNIIKEILLFFGGRLFSGICDTSLMYLFIDILSISDSTSKIIIQIIVIILNYLISKIIVFRN
ncbi:GtrA family protein [uncultured Methanobrevibacter sp.]|uniref:GtrA family protein n=1 Tax=uncultured Methanobrevibacter sp. TaxID=253161 RepID=UPI0025D070D4|nr:GtrA family protein [uncultured Methanobrevibacter sp.]